jgi:biofilm PGA synthesis N-glycosyltransferase PgaC
MSANFESGWWLLPALAASLGVSITFWCTIGVLRLCWDGLFARRRGPQSLTVADVAVIIPAHNEEVALPKCLAALTAIVPASQIHVASDGSKDRTVAIAREAGCNVLDIQPNGGKARALASAVEHFGLCERYKAVLIQDADSEIDPHYLEHALPLFNDSRNVVVAGHVLSRWRKQAWPSRDMLYAAYRTRLYRLLQFAFQYGQTWRFTNVSYIAPGFASMYRASVLKHIDITAPGLVIEDFNMTFEVQRKGLGRVAYSPKARCSSEDPFTLNDYRKQVQRWYLGFWQTVRRHGVWPSIFWLSLGALLVELLTVSALVLALPVMVVLHLAADIQMPAFSLFGMHVEMTSPLPLASLFLIADYGLTVIVSLLDRRPSMLLYGLLFPLIRLLDAALFWRALINSFVAKSDGRWISPQRYAGGRDAHINQPA